MRDIFQIIPSSSLLTSMVYYGVGKKRRGKVNIFNYNKEDLEILHFPVFVSLHINIKNVNNVKILKSGLQIICNVMHYSLLLSLV